MQRDAGGPGLKLHLHNKYFLSYLCYRPINVENFSKVIFIHILHKTEKMSVVPMKE